MLRRTIIVLCFAVCYVFSNAQTLLTSADSLASIKPFLRQQENKAVYLDTKIEQKTIKLLVALQKKEDKLEKKLHRKDSLASSLVFADNHKLYEGMIDQIRHPSVQPLQEYIPGFDSIKTSLAFLGDGGSGLRQHLPADVKEKITSLSAQVTSLQSRMQAADEIKQKIRQRRDELQQQLGKYGLTKDLKKLNKQVYYYRQQLAEYKSVLRDRKKAEEKLLSSLRKLPAFQSFMKQHSQLAYLFRLPETYGTPQALAGLQTRASIQEQLQQHFAGSSVNPQQYIGQQVQQAQGELNKLKDKLGKFGGEGSYIEMPDFKPNTQKTKRFLQRIEYGANIQSQKTNGLIPVTSDVALTAGFKLNDKSVIGIGAAYKMGWGSGWRHMKLSSEGMGIRSFIDYKVKGSFWLSGGYEQNYQHAFTTVEELKIFDAWQASGLIGITKKYKIGKKTNNMQLLWDFLSYQQVPRRQAVLFRVGYQLK